MKKVINKLIAGIIAIALVAMPVTVMAGETSHFSFTNVAPDTFSFELQKTDEDGNPLENTEFVMGIYSNTKLAQNVYFKYSEITKYVGDEPFVNELIGVADDAYVTYSCSDESVATVNEEGQITILSYGEVIIEAFVAGTDIYDEAHASFKLVVNNVLNPDAYKPLALNTYALNTVAPYDYMYDFYYCFTNDAEIYNYRDMTYDKDYATTLVTDNHGEIYVNGVPALNEGESYFLIETSAPDGYEAISDPIIFTVVDGEIVLESNSDAVKANNSIITVVDKEASYGFGLNKTDEDGKIINGAHFTMADADGNTLLFTESNGTYTASNSGATYIEAGSVTIDGLSQGKYTLSESAMPNGYYATNKSTTITIASDGTISVSDNDDASVEDGTVSVVNKDLSNAYTLTKTADGDVYYVGDTVTYTIVIEQTEENVYGINSNYFVFGDYFGPEIKCTEAVASVDGKEIDADFTIDNRDGYDIYCWVLGQYLEYGKPLVITLTFEATKSGKDIENYADFDYSISQDVIVANDTAYVDVLDRTILPNAGGFRTLWGIIIGSAVVAAGITYAATEERRRNKQKIKTQK